jgi:hypothetical protein
VARSTSPFAGFLSDFFGAGPIPPESVARKVLGIGVYLPLNRAGIKAAFRFQVKLLRPDLPDSSADALRRDDLKGDTATRLAELLWARDDLLNRVKEPVTGADVIRVPDVSRNGDQCKVCQRNWHELRDNGYYGGFASGDWAGYCGKCAHDAELEERRELRRQARADRPCQGCGRLFTGSRSDSRYCSNACRQRAYRQRQVELEEA